MAADHKKSGRNLWGFWLSFFVTWSDAIRLLKTAFFARKQADAEIRRARYELLPDVQRELDAERMADWIVLVCAIVVMVCWLTGWVIG